MSEKRNVGGLVDELIHQFTDPFAFYRELVQNSLDAGSSRVEVTLRYQPGADAGLCLASVADWGEGMNRDLVENYLVTKFRSTKENDFTKIGKFGIGFVSVFACEPEAVTVDTGRDGESWRVLFREDTTWELLQSHEPIEGTKVTLHKRMSPKDYASFVEQSLLALKKWCRHSAADVVFAAGKADGSPPPPAAPIGERIAVDAPFQVEHVEEGTHIVAGPARSLPPLTGYYNRGLTLLETTDEVVPGVALKIVSRYLEHTLTRDDLRRDKHFDTAMGLVRRLVEGPLAAALPAELEKAAAARDGLEDWQVLFDYARERVPPKALWLRVTGGGAVSIAAVKKALSTSKELVLAVEASPLVERMRVAGLPVLELSPGPRLRAVERLVGAKGSAQAAQAWSYVEPPLLPREVFAAAVLDLLGRMGARVSQVVVAEVRGGAAGLPTAVVDGIGRPLPTPLALRSPFARDVAPMLVFNTSHELVGAAAPLFDRAPRLAAALLVRLLLVKDGRLDDATDRRLTEWGLA